MHAKSLIFLAGVAAAMPRTWQNRAPAPRDVATGPGDDINFLFTDFSVGVAPHTDETFFSFNVTAPTTVLRGHSFGALPCKLRRTSPQGRLVLAEVPRTICGDPEYNLSFSFLPVNDGEYELMVYHKTSAEATDADIARITFPKEEIQIKQFGGTQAVELEHEEKFSVHALTEPDSDPIATSKKNKKEASKSSGGYCRA